MIRLLTPDDVDSFQQLRLLALRESPDSFGSSYDREAKRELTELVEKIRPRADGSVVLGFFADTNSLIGIIGFAREEGPKEQHKGFIWGMYVHPEHRRQQIGFKLIQAALRHAQQFPGLRQIKLTVTASNHAAEKLYARAGFIPYGIEKDSLATAGGFLDEQLMVLRIG